MGWIRRPEGWYYEEGDYRIGPATSKHPLREELRRNPPPEPKPKRRVEKPEEE